MDREWIMEADAAQQRVREIGAACDKVGDDKCQLDKDLSHLRLAVNPGRRQQEPTDDLALEAETTEEMLDLRARKYQDAIQERAALQKEISQGSDALSTACQKMARMTMQLTATDMQQQAPKMDSALLTQLHRVLMHYNGGSLDYLRQLSPDHRQLLLGEEARARRETPTQSQLHLRADEVEQLRQELAIATRQVSDLQEAQSALESEVDREKKQAAQASAALREAENKLDEAIAAEKRTKATVDLNASRHEKESASLREQLDDANSEIDDLIKKLSTALGTAGESERKQQILGLNAKIDELEGELDEQTAQAARLKVAESRVRSLEAENKNLRSDVRHLEAEASKLRRLADSQTERIESDRLNANRLQDDLRKAREEAQREREIRDAKIEDLREVVQTGTTRIDKLVCDVDDVYATLADTCNLLLGATLDETQWASFLSSLRSSSPVEPASWREEDGVVWCVRALGAGNGETSTRETALAMALGGDAVVVALFAAVQLDRTDDPSTLALLHQLANMLARGTSPLRIHPIELVLRSMGSWFNASPDRVPAGVLLACWQATQSLLDRWPVSAESVLGPMLEDMRASLARRDPVLRAVADAIRADTMMELCRSSGLLFGEDLFLFALEDRGCLLVDVSKRSILPVRTQHANLLSTPQVSLEALGETFVLDLNETRLRWVLRRLFL